MLPHYCHSALNEGFLSLSALSFVSLFLPSPLPLFLSLSLSSPILSPHPPPPPPPFSSSAPSGVYSFGLFATTIFANAGQVVTGNQTPHFLSACRPNYTVLGCQSPMQYITERRACTGNPYLVASARKSFPSKDAALSIYSAVYTVVGTRGKLEGKE